MPYKFSQVIKVLRTNFTLTAMNKTVVIIFVFAIVLVSIDSVQPVHSASLGKIFIKPNGGVDPSTAPISKSGETYMLTGNIGIQVVLETDDIILEGNGYSLRGSGSGVGINMTCSNVTVQNLNVIDWEDGVLGVFNNNTIKNCLITQCYNTAIGIYAQSYAIIDNNIESNNNGIVIGQGGLNFIEGNNIANNNNGIYFYDSNNEIVQNNFENCSQSAITIDASGGRQIVYNNNFVNNLKDLSDYTYNSLEGPSQFSFWDNGSTGNYWSDYTGFDTNGGGIGDTPFMIPTYLEYNETAPNGFVDRYPLISPFNFITPIPQFSINFSQTTLPQPVSNSTGQAIALSFLKNVIQLDLSKYTATLTSDVSRTLNPETSAEYLSYSLVYFRDGSERTADAYLTISNNLVTSVSLEPTGGSLLFTYTFSNNFDTARKIMQNYQTSRNDPDLNKMVKMLNTVGSAKNMTELLDNLGLKVLTSPAQTTFNWSYIYNGVDYSSVRLALQNNYVFSILTFSDNRGIYNIGNTNINIPQQQAIQIAKDYVRELSYPINYGNGTITTVNGLNINETNTIANLSATSLDSATLYPFWSVQMPLDHIYPGKTFAVTVGVWAGNGTVFNAQRDINPLSSTVPSLVPFSLLAFIPILAISFVAFIIVVVSLLFLINGSIRKNRSVEDLFVSGRSTQEVKDEVLRWFKKNKVDVVETHEDLVKGRWGTGIVTASKYFEISFKPIRSGVAVHAEGWISIFGITEHSFSPAALMGWIPRREGWCANEKLLTAIKAMSTITKICPQCGRAVNEDVPFCQYCGKQLH